MSVKWKIGPSLTLALASKMIIHLPNKIFKCSIGSETSKVDILSKFCIQLNPKTFGKSKTMASPVNSNRKNKEPL